MNEHQIEQERDRQIEYIENTQTELDDMVFSVISGDLAQIFAINYKPHNNVVRIRTALLMLECAERKVMEEAAYRTAQWVEENE